MRSVTMCAISLLSATAMGQTLESAAVWNSGPGANGNEYRLYSFPNGINWDDAQSLAQSLGGFLATITSADENAFVFSSLAIASNNNVWHVDVFNSAIGPWLGGLQSPGAPEPAGGWGWVNGDTWSFTAWAPGEPNNSGGTENRNHYFGGGNNRSSNWNDITNTELVHGMVVEIIPTPGSVSLLAMASLGLVRRRR